MLGKRARERHRRLEAGHSSAAEQSVARAVERFLDGGRVGQRLGRVEIIANHLEMPAHLLDEDIGEHGIHAVGIGRGIRVGQNGDTQRLAREAFGFGVPFGKRFGLLHQEVNVHLRRSSRSRAVRVAAAAPSWLR